MMHEEVTHLHNNGIKRFGGEYWDAALYGLRDKVFIRYDWHDLRQVWVYRMDGTYLCMAKRQGMVHPMFKLIGGKDAEGYSDFKAAIGEHERLKAGTKKIVRKLSKAGLIAELLIPETGLFWGCHYLAWLRDKYFSKGGWPGVLRAYNGGPGNWDNSSNHYPDDVLSHIPGGVWPVAEVSHG